MILDGYWEKELKTIIKLLKRWSSKRSDLFHDLAEHKVNQGLLYSAVIIRKIVEDENDVKPFFDERGETEKYLKILCYNVPVVKYKHVGEEKFFVNSKLILSDYDTKHAEQIELPLNQICNQLIHSYVWSIVHTNNMKEICGVLTASDRFKEEVYLLKIEDWINTLDYVVENSSIYTKESII